MANAYGHPPGTNPALRTRKEMLNCDTDNKRVLVVDDDPVFCFSSAISLKMAGYEVWEASNGRWALEIIEAERKAGRDFVLFLVDLIMPFMDGMQLVREIRKIDQTDRVLVVSGSIDDEVIEELESVGCRHWLTKPFMVNQLMEAIGKTQARGRTIDGI
jgi:CheY-like chemotaxis protein